MIDMQRKRMDLVRGAGRQAGFTLVELLIVVTIVGILSALAVPAYVGLQARAADGAARANIRTAAVAAEAFAMDNIGAKGDADGKAATSGYKGMTIALLRTKYDKGIAATLKVVSGKTTVTQYCLTDTQQGRAWSALGPGLAATSFKGNAKCK
jgi:prepilin-type N-terminal cleavage/methylation domain-containing protein